MAWLWLAVGFVVGHLVKSRTEVVILKGPPSTPPPGPVRPAAPPPIPRRADPALHNHGGDMWITCDECAPFKVKAWAPGDSTPHFWSTQCRVHGCSRSPVAYL